jgi:hypothetical protein
MDRNFYQQSLVGHSGQVGDEGGHLSATSNGGSGDRINMVPQSADLNHGAKSEWRAMENQINQALKEGKTVDYKLEITFPDTTTARPNLFSATYKIDGEVFSGDFPQ